MLLQLLFHSRSFMLYRAIYSQKMLPLLRDQVTEYSPLLLLLRGTKRDGPGLRPYWGLQGAGTQSRMFDCDDIDIAPIALFGPPHIFFALAAVRTGMWSQADLLQLLLQAIPPPPLPSHGQEKRLFIIYI